LIDPEKIEEANARGSLPAGGFPMDDIRFNFDLAGGALMDLGTYTISALRGIFRHDPTRCTSATARLVPAPFDQRCESAMEATYDFPNNGVGKMAADLAGRVKYEKGKGGWWAWLFNGWPDLRTDLPPWVSVKMRAEHSAEGDNSVTKQKEITFHNFMGPHGGHRIETNTTITYRNAQGKVFDVKKQVETKKQYVWPEGKGGGVTGEEFWTTYRYQLEAFVDRVKGRNGSGVWLDGEDSIAQMEVIDRTYEKAGLAIRPRRTELDRW
jgi:predicted dehydrogenase